MEQAANTHIEFNAQSTNTTEPHYPYEISNHNSSKGILRYPYSIPQKKNILIVRTNLDKQLQGCSQLTNSMICIYVNDGSEPIIVCSNLTKLAQMKLYMLIGALENQIDRRNQGKRDIPKLMLIRNRVRSTTVVWEWVEAAEGGVRVVEREREVIERWSPVKGGSTARVHSHLPSRDLV